LRDIDLKSLWTRTAKKLKTASTSTPIQQTVESRVQSNSPSIHLEAHAEMKWNQSLLNQKWQALNFKLWEM
jgi:hypothetical protein